MQINKEKFLDFELIVNELENKGGKMPYPLLLSKIVDSLKYLKQSLSDKCKHCDKDLFQITSVFGDKAFLKDSIVANRPPTLQDRDLSPGKVWIHQHDHYSFFVLIGFSSPAREFKVNSPIWQYAGCSKP